MRKTICILIMILVTVLPAAVNLEAEKRAELNDLARPEMMTTDGGKLFIVDGYEVYVYSMKDHKLLGKFGNKGSGPGEFAPSFANRIQIQLHNGNILLNSTRKMAWFTHKGELVREKRLTFLAIQVVPVDDNFAVTRFMPGQNGVNMLTVQLLNDKMETLKTLYQRDDISHQRSGKLDCPNEQIFVRCAADKLYIMDQRDTTFHIRVFDKKGNPLTPIKKDYPPLKMPDSYKQEVMDWVESRKSMLRQHATNNMGMSIEQLKKMVYYHPIVPAARYFHADDKMLIVETFIKKNKLSQFIVLDTNGKVLKKVFLTDAEPGKVKMFPKAGYTFYKNRHLYLWEDLETETWELHETIF